MPHDARVIPGRVCRSVRVEDLFTEKTSLPRPSGPVGKVRKLFDQVANLPRRQQDKIVEFLAPIIEDFKRKAG